jgi:type VI secretion system protein ImpE
MLAKDSLKSGDVGRSLHDVQDEIRRRPADVKNRILLFQLLVLVGDWQRAVNQLQVIAGLDAAALPMVHTYREAIRCEVLRAKVFAGQATPLVFGDPQQWVALLLEALRLTAEGNHQQAQQLRDQAFDRAPAIPGTVDGQPFAWIADADPRLGPVLEMIVNGAYYWVPFGSIGKLAVDQPADLRDLVWATVQVTWSNGGDAFGLVPTRYSGSEANADAQIQLARKTEWSELAPEMFCGQGQRMLATDEGDYSLLDVRTIILETATGGAEFTASASATHEDA